MWFRGKSFCKALLHLLETVAWRAEKVVPAKVRQITSQLVVSVSVAGPASEVRKQYPRLGHWFKSCSLIPTGQAIEIYTPADRGDPTSVPMTEIQIPVTEPQPPAPAEPDAKPFCL